MTTIKITELTDIGANLASSTVLPVVNMSGTPTTQKTILGNIANVVLAGAGGNYVAAAKATTANTVTINAQPNITSTGNLIGLTVSNANGVVNFTTTANVTLGAVGNLHIAGGTTDQLLTTDGAGNLSWTTVSGGNGTPSGSNTQIQFNDAGAFGGNTGFTFDKTTGILAAPFADVSGVANIVGGGATVATKSVLNVASTFGSNDANDPASAQAVRGRVTGANLTKTRNYVTGVTGQYLVTGTNASEFIKAGILGVVGDQTTTADGAVVAYLDGDGGLTTANAAYAVSMKNSTPNSGFNYGLDLQFINLNVAGTTTTFKQADIRFNNGVTLVANTANNISINANVTAGNVLTSAQVIANGIIESGTGISTGGYLSVNGNTDLHDTTVTGNLSATGNITATNLGNIVSVNLTGSNANVLYGNGVFAAVAGGGANTGNVTFSDINIIGTGNLKLQPDSANANAYLDIFLTAGPDIHIAGNGETVILGTDDYANVAVNIDGNVSIQAGNVGGTQTWNFGVDGNITLPGNTFAVNYANGTAVSIGGGANTGNVTFDDNIVIGTGDEFGDGGLYLAPSPGSVANSAVQYLRVRGGDAPTHIHLDTGNNQFYDQYFGDDAKYVKLELGDAGNVVVGTDDANGNLYSWSFTSDGNLILAGGNSVIQSIANSSLDPVNPNVSTMVLTPDANYNSQVLVLDPTAPGHIHLRAYAFSNIDEPAANIFLGGEDTAFEITSGANNQAVIHSNGKAWTFGDDGNISSDTLTFTTTFANVKTVEYQTAGVWDLYVEDSITGSNTAISRLNVSFKDNLIDKPQVYIENTKESDGIALRWTFDENGNLTVPGSIINDTSIVLSAPAIFNICTIATAGSGYNTGSSLKATTGGSGTGMTVGIGYGLSNQLTSVNVVNPGTGYVNGDVITVSEGTGGTFVLTKYNQSANQTNNNTIQTDFTFANSTVTLPIYGAMATDASMTLTTNLANAGNTSSWIFGDDGKLTFPGTPRIDTSTNNFEVQAAEAINFEANTVVNIYTDAGNNAFQWQFGDDGNLTLPDTTSVLANVNITLEANDTGNITGLNLIGDSNANLYAHGNVKIVSDSSNTTATWTFGADGNLTIPGTSGGFIKTVSNASIGVAAVDNGTNNPAQLLSINAGSGAATSIVSAYATNATIQTNATGTLNTWQFDNAGNLTLPTGGQIVVSGGLVSSGASPAPTINGFSITNSVGISGNGNIAGNNISATGNITANNFIGNGNTLSNVATKTSGSWTLAAGNNTVNISVPLNGTYSIWVNGNIPNGIITYTATAVVTNTNVPALGSQYAWYYAVGNALVFTSIPDQFVGTVGSISNVNTYIGNTANVFTFGITNNSGNTAVVNYGYTKL